MPIILFAPRSMAVVIFASDKSIAVVTFPPDTPAILRPIGKARSVSRF